MTYEQKQETIGYIDSLRDCAHEYLDDELAKEAITKRLNAIEDLIEEIEVDG